MNKKILIPIFLVLLLVGFYLYFQKHNQNSTNSSVSQIDNSQVQVASSNLDQDQTTTITPNQTIEITFNIPLENTGEFKNKFTPDTQVNLTLSSDRKTIKITPKDSFKLGTDYTLEILPDSKFNQDTSNKSTQKILDHTITFHFKTIDYRGV